MGLEIIDGSGQPRTDEELQEAIDAVGQIMVKQPFVLPLFTVHSGIIFDCLRELQSYRAIIAKAKKDEEQHSS
jgi:hypothetical protein